MSYTDTIGKGYSGPQVTLRVHVEERLALSFDSISNNNKRRINGTPYIPDLKDGVLRRSSDKFIKEFDINSSIARVSEEINIRNP